MAEPPDTTVDDLIERLELQVPAEDVRASNTLAALKEQIRSEREANALRVGELEEAYAALVSPANRTAIFVRELDEDAGGRVCIVAAGEEEFVCRIDPMLEDELATGTRVRLSESFAVIGVLEHRRGGPLVKVADCLADGRVRLAGDVGGGGGRLVERAEELAPAVIEAGDEVRLDSSGRVIIEHFGRKEAKEYFVEEVPDIDWSDVGGQDEAIRLIRETIELPILHPELFAKYEKSPPKGILLYGPPGCGKTLIGKATACSLTKEYSKRVGHEVKECFLHISGPKILNMWLGETERMVREIFATARAKAKLGYMVFIFVDEAESVLRTRSSGRWLNISNTVVPQFCAELDGLVSLDNVVLMLTSNRPDYIDPAVLRPERIDRKVKISRPNKEASRQILGIYLHAGLPLEPATLETYQGDADCARCHIIEEAISYLWAEADYSQFLKVFYRSGKSQTLYWKDMVSGALLKSVVDRAKDAAIRRAIADPSVDQGIGADDLRAAIEAEYRENEIFPKNDAQEDWLKLLDFEPENVTSVKAVTKSESKDRHNSGVS